MRPKDRQKMCTNCDGRIAIEAVVCPYCGAETQMHNAIQESLTALYPPPYSSKGTGIPENIQPPREAMQEKRFNQANISLGAPTIPADVGEQQRTQEEQSSFWPVLMLSIGANLLVIGLLQLFFSDEGFLRLEWSSHYWYIYCLAALPLFYLGMKKANALQ